MPSAKHLALCYVALAALALTAYGPALSGGFLWDDTDWIADNETLRTWAGLGRIWFEPGAVIQYYPLTYTSWWLDYQLWGLSPTIMHVESVLLHAFNALLFGTLLRRLGLPGAILAALVFLLHPVHSESVAWLVERKNTLSAAFFLGACHLWLTHVDGSARRSLLACLGCFVAALLAKTATLMLPVTLLALLIWRRRGWRGSRTLLPFVALSLLAAIVTIVMERGEGAVGHDWALTTAQRLLLTGQVVGFYLQQLLAPFSLSFVYAKWELTTTSPLAWVPTAALTLALLATTRMRRPTATAIGLALWVYVANLLPVSGLVDFYYLRYAFAADHFQYLPSLGPIALISCGGAWLLREAPRHTGMLLAATISLALAVGTWQRAHIYTDLETLWRTTIEAEPDAWLAHSNLGHLYALRGDPDGGVEHHRRAVAIYPDAFESNNALGNYLTRQGDYQTARQHFDRALAVRPDDALTYSNLGAMAGFQGDLKQALNWFEQGYQRAPENRDLLRNLAVLLAQAPDPALRDGPRALRLARRLNDVPDPSLLDQQALFFAMLVAGDRVAAVTLGRDVLQRAEREGNQQTTQRVGQVLQRLGR